MYNWDEFILFAHTQCIQNVEQLIETAPPPKEHVQFPGDLDPGGRWIRIHIRIRIQTLEGNTKIFTKTKKWLCYFQLLFIYYQMIYVPNFRFFCSWIRIRFLNTDPYINTAITRGKKFEENFKLTTYTVLSVRCISSNNVGAVLLSGFVVFGWKKRS